jgi:hypothetical protein
MCIGVLGCKVKFISYYWPNLKCLKPFFHMVHKLVIKSASFYVSIACSLFATQELNMHSRQKKKKELGKRKRIRKRRKDQRDREELEEEGQGKRVE